MNAAVVHNSFSTKCLRWFLLFGINTWAEARACLISCLFYCSLICLYLLHCSFHCHISGLGILFQALWMFSINQTTFVVSYYQFSSVAQSCPTLCDPMNCSTPGLPVHYQVPEFTQTHVDWIGDAIQPSHPLSFPLPLALNLSQHQGLFQWVSSSHQVAKVLEFQLQHQSFQWIFRIDFL